MKSWLRYIIYWLAYAILHGAFLFAFLVVILRFADWDGPTTSEGIDLIHYLWWPSSDIYDTLDNKSDILEAFLICLPSIMWGGILVNIHFGIRNHLKVVRQ